MKKMSKLLAIVVAVFMLASSLCIVSHAEGGSYTTVNFNDGVKAYSTSYIFPASATYFNEPKSLAFQPVYFEGSNGSLGDANSTDVSFPGVRRSMLTDIAETVIPGEYKISIMVCDPLGMLTNENTDFGLLLSFHESEIYDDTLIGEWYDKAFTPTIVKIFDTHGAEVNSDSYLDGTMEAGETKQGKDGKTWTEYTATVTFDVAVSKVALWIYQPGGEFGDYNNQYPKTDGHQVYVDDLIIHSDDPEQFSNKDGEETTAEETTAEETTTKSDVTTEGKTTEAVTTAAQTTAGETTGETDNNGGFNPLYIVLIAVAAAIVIAAVVIIIVKKKKK